ncbi:polyprenyl synthetase family protein [Streptomyces sp. NPDC058108]|uniref:polyprenyl synthetase family protein n=1 Tax=Streptomyces sp. NPDC058108 TaxID=3346344 RepID=UPI0036E2398A
MRPSKPNDDRAVEPPAGSPHARRREDAFTENWLRPGPSPQPHARVDDSDRSPTPAEAGFDELTVIDADVPAAVERYLADLLADRARQATALDPVFAHDLADRVARFTLVGGKRTRAQFLWWAQRACGGQAAEAQSALRVGSALELIQACALVHDDVMDGSRLRRGLPALHKDVAAQYAGAVLVSERERFGESAAILAGDLALAWADDVLAETELSASRGQRVRALWSAMRMEMVAGQYLDIQGQATSSRSLAHAIRAACLKSALYSVERPLALGAALADADDATTGSLCSAGRCVGIAFQLRDDLLDVFGSTGHSGKPSGGDIRSGKPTYLVAVAQARAEARNDRRALRVLKSSLGCAGLSEDGLARVREVLVSIGARAMVESKISRLAAQGVRHLEAAALGDDGRRRLRDLMQSATGIRPPENPSADSLDACDSLLSVSAEGSSR